MDNFSKNERILTIIYFMWFFLHLGFFFYAGEVPDTSQFWPFVKSGVTLDESYDVSEFLIYISVPLVVFIAYKIINYENDQLPIKGHRHANSSYFQAFLNERIKAEELTQKINELTNQPVNYDYLNELKKDKESAGTEGVNHWLDRVELKKKYKEFEN